MFALAAGLGLGILIYGFVRVVEGDASGGLARAVALALLVGALLGLAFMVGIKLALRQAAYDLHNYAVDLTDTQLPPLVSLNGDEVVYMRETLAQALAYVPRPEIFPLLADDLAAAPDLNAQLAAAARHAGQHLPVIGALLLLLDAERSVLYPEVVCGEASVAPDMAIDLYASAIGRALQERRPALYSGLEAADMLPVRAAGAIGTSLYCLPLLVRGQAFGVLALLLPGSEIRLNEEQRNFARAVADLFTLAAQGGMHRRLFEREGDRLAAFEQLGALIDGSERFDRALEQVLRVAARVTDSAHGSLLLLEPDESRVRLRITLKAGDVLPLSVTAGPILRHGLAGWALRERRADIIEDTERDTRWLPVPGLDDMRSAMIVPLLYGERILGLLTMADQAPRHYSRRSLAMAAALAAHAVTILARQQREELVEPDAASLARRLFEGRLAPGALADLVADRPALVQALGPWRGQVVVLYAGLRGAERAAERLAADQLLDEVITPFVTELSAIIHDNAGFVIRHEDGGLLAIFGYPRALPDDRARAVRAALAAQTTVRRLRGRWRNQFGCELAVSIGLAQGEASAGVIGEAPFQSLNMLGAALRDARRLQQLARPDEVIVGDMPGAAVGSEDGISLEPLAPLTMADGEPPRPIFRLSPGRAS
jgi:class 3 adenylate cyclase